MMTPPTPDQIKSAAKRIAPYVHRTPVMTSDAQGVGRIEYKFEHTQVTGSFKARGAFNTLLSGDVPAAGVVAASGGNHGAAVAHAAKTLGHAARIYVPEIAGPSKIALIRETGADLHVVPGTYAEAHIEAVAYEAQTGAMQIHPFDAVPTIEGQGTVMLEWEEQGLEADTVLIAVGGGGLIGGALAWLNGRRKVVAIEPALAPTLHDALIHGPDHRVEVGGVAANALGSKAIGRLSYDLAKAQGIETILVQDEAITTAQHLIWSSLRQLVEPAGATALAALISGAYTPKKGEKVAVLLCGANPAPSPFAEQ